MLGVAAELRPLCGLSFDCRNHQSLDQTLEMPDPCWRLASPHRSAAKETSADILKRPVLPEGGPFEADL